MGRVGDGRREAGPEPGTSSSSSIMHGTVVPSAFCRSRSTVEDEVHVLSSGPVMWCDPAPRRRTGFGVFGGQSSRYVRLWTGPGDCGLGDVRPPRIMYAPVLGPQAHGTVRHPGTRVPQTTLWSLGGAMGTFKPQNAVLELEDSKRVLGSVDSLRLVSPFSRIRFQSSSSVIVVVTLPTEPMPVTPSAYPTPPTSGSVPTAPPSSLGRLGRASRNGIDLGPAPA